MRAVSASPDVWTAKPSLNQRAALDLGRLLRAERREREQVPKRLDRSCRSPGCLSVAVGKMDPVPRTRRPLRSALVSTRRRQEFHLLRRALGSRAKTRPSNRLAE